MTKDTSPLPEALARLKSAALVAEPIYTDLYGDRYAQGAWSRVDLTKEQDDFVSACTPDVVLALFAQLEASQRAPVAFVNSGEQPEDTSATDCPHCGGSGHKDDVRVPATGEGLQTVNIWHMMFDQLALALNCLPSSFIDGNAHVLKKAAELVASHPASVGDAKEAEPVTCTWPECICSFETMVAGCKTRRK